MLPGDRLVCALVEPKMVGFQFKDWPLHLTIVPWFRLTDSSLQIAKALHKALITIRPFEAKVVGWINLGAKHNRPANLLESASFPEIEQLTREYLHKKRAWLVDETTKAKLEIKPHVTFQNDQHLKNDDRLFCDRLYIVEQTGPYKEIAGELLLGRL